MMNKSIIFLLIVVLLTFSGTASGLVLNINTIENDDQKNSKKDKELIVKQKYDEIKQWTIHSVIPSLNKFSADVDPKFQGVKYCLSLLKDTSFLDKRINELTDSDPNYWRGIMEMNKGNQLITSSKIFMHVAAGEFDIAKRYLEIIKYFSDKDAIASLYLDTLNIKFTQFYGILNKEIEKGVVLHDKGKYAKAIEVYEGILSQYPNSAWANYELYYSKSSMIKSIDQSLQIWSTHKNIIYKCDPLYPMNINATTGKEGYLLFRRQEISGLFTKNENTIQDIINYAI